MGYSMPADEGLRGDVELLSGTAPDAARRGRHRRHQRRGARHRARLDHQGAVPGTDAGVHRRRHRRLRWREEPRRHHVGVLRHRDRPDGARGRPASSTPSACSAEDGVSQAELAERLNAVVPKGTEAVTGHTVAKENADAVKKDLKVVGILFMIFAGIALFVGSFIIWNTFTMIVTQRSREIALLRAIGATRRQVMRSLLVEAFVVGVGSVGGRHRPRAARGQGAEGADGRGGLQPAEHVAAARAPHHLGLAARRHPGHGRLRAGAGPSCHQGAAGRGAARVDPGRREAVAEARPGRSRVRRGRCRRDALRAVRRRRA